MPINWESIFGKPEDRVKGLGYFGQLKRPDGMLSTELSAGVSGPEYGGKEIQIPLLVPTLTQDEINLLLSGGKVTEEIYRKAEEHARMRLSKGLDPFAQPGEQKPIKPSPKEESFVDWQSIFGEPEIEEPIPQKPSTIQNILGLLKKITPDIKEAFLGMPEVQRFTLPPIMKLKKEALPAEPIIRPMTPKEKYIEETGLGRIVAAEEAKKIKPKFEDLEFGKFEQFLDIPGQFLTHYANMTLWGFPGLINKALFKEPLPPAKTELGGVAGGLGALGGLAGWAAGQAAAFAPFRLSGEVIKRVWRKPAQTLVGKVAQNVFKNMGTLGLAMGAVEWEGKDPVTVLKNKAVSAGGGAFIGSVFGTTQFVNLTNSFPLLSHVFRFGIASAVLDIAGGRSPVDERGLFEKAFDYGLNAWFTREAVSPKEFQSLFESLTKEAKRFQHEAKTDGLNINLVPSEEVLRDKLTRLVTEPEKWVTPEEKAKQELTPPVTRIVTPGGTVMVPETPEKTVLETMYREAEIGMPEIAPKVAVEVPVEIPKKAPEKILTKEPIEKEVPISEVIKKKKFLYRFIPKDAPQIWFDVMDVTSGKGIRPYKDGFGKPIELEEYYANIPKPLRRPKEGFAPDIVAQALKLEGGDKELYEKLSLARRKPELKPPAEYEPTEAELAEADLKVKEGELLRGTGKTEEEISAFLKNALIDGGESKKITKEVLARTKSEKEAISQLKDLIETTVKKVEPEFVKPPEVKIEEPKIEYPAHAEEKGWSPEAISRTKKISFYSYDTRTKTLRPINGVEAVDVKPRATEIKLQENLLNKKVTLLDVGESAKYSPEDIKNIETNLIPKLKEKIIAASKEIKEKPEEFKLVAEEEIPKKIEKPKAEEKKLFTEPEEGRFFPAKFDDRGMRSYKDINEARADIQKYVDDGWSVELGQAADRIKAWGKLVSKKGTGQGEIKYVPLAVKPTLEPEKVQLKLTEEKPTLIKEEAVKLKPKDEVKELFEEERGEPYKERIGEIEKEIEKAIEEKKVFTEEQKTYLAQRGIYEEKKAPEEKEIAVTEEKIEREPEKIKLVRFSVITPTGKVENLGELPEEKYADRIIKYAKDLGIEDKLKTTEAYSGNWGEYLPPAEIEKYMKDVLRDVKRKPKEQWQEWEGEIQKTRENWAGLPPPEFARKAATWLLDALQVEPQFKRIGAPETGLAFKAYHPRRNAELDKSISAARDLMKNYKLTPEEWQKMTLIASKPTKFYRMSKEDRAKYSPVYKDINNFFKDYAERLKKVGVIIEEWPLSALRRMSEQRSHLEVALDSPRMTKERVGKIKEEINDIDLAISFIKKSKPQYIHIPRTWLESFWEKNAENAPKIVSQFFRERKTLDLEELANFLIDKNYIKPKDLDIRKIMAIYGHKVGHKIALAEIINAGTKEGLIKDIDEAPRNWQALSRHIFPTLRGKRIHPVFVDYFEKNLIKQGFMPPVAGRLLGTIKLLQFYNPLFLPMYDVVQTWWSGALISPKLPRYIKRAYISMVKKDEPYWDMSYWGGFSTPYTPSFDTYVKQIDRKLGERTFLKRAGQFLNVYQHSWTIAWWLDNLIRMIPYHYYVEKGYSPKDAAQLTARAQADYASIPPSTRKFLNKFLFTPSFKISMMAAQTEMIKDAGKYLFGGSKIRQGMPAYEKQMAKMLTGLVSGVILRDLTMHALGFKTDQFGLKYVKTIQTDEGEKELVIHAASPDNVFLRFFHRFKSLPTEHDKFKGFLERARWEAHPAWQWVQEVSSNKSFSSEPIYNPFDDPKKITADVLKYTAARIFRISEILPGMPKSTRGLEAYKALVKDVGKVGLVISWFALPYLRNTKEQRTLYKLRELIDQFKYLERNKPGTEENFEERFNSLQKQIEKLMKDLE